MSGRWGWTLARDMSDAEWLVAQQDYDRLLEGLTAMVRPPFPFSIDEKIGFLKKIHGRLTRKMHTPPFDERPRSETQLELWSGPNARHPGHDPAWNAAIFPKLAGEYSIDAAGGLHELALMGWLAALHLRRPGIVNLTDPIAEEARWEEALLWAGACLEQTFTQPTRT